MSATPEQSVSSDWQTRRRRLIRLGTDAEEVAAAVRVHDYVFGEMEAALANRRWLAGEAFSLADIGVTPYVNRVEMLGMHAWIAAYPRVEAWFDRVRERPTFHPSFITWCPDDLIADLQNYGGQNWPAIQRMLKLEAA